MRVAELGEGGVGREEERGERHDEEAAQERPAEGGSEPAWRATAPPMGASPKPRHRRETSGRPGAPTTATEAVSQAATRSIATTQPASSSAAKEARARASEPKTRARAARAAGSGGRRGHESRDQHDAEPERLTGQQRGRA